MSVDMENYVQENLTAAREGGIHIPEVPLGPRVVVCTVHTTNYQELADITVPLMRAYALKHNYDFVCIPDWEVRYPDLANDGDRFKARMYENLYQANKEHDQWDVFMWIDADALIMNSAISVDQLLTRLTKEQGLTEDHHFVWGYDVGGPNSGIYFARFTPEAAAFQRTQLARSTEMGWGDNTAMIQVSCVFPYTAWVKVVPGKYFNCYLADHYGWSEFAAMNGYADGDFILHLPGMRQETRIPIAREYALKAV